MINKIKDTLQCISLGAAGLIILFVLAFFFNTGGVPDIARATHGMVIQWIEGIHAEGDGGLARPILIGGDDGTDVKNINVDPTSGNIQVDVISSPVILSQPFDAIKTSGSVEIVGKDDAAMTQDELSDDLGVALGGTYSGEVVQACLTQSEENTGAILADIALRLFVFSADPSVSVGDTLIATASHAFLIDEVAFANASFWIDAGAATYCMPMNTLFHAVATLWFVIATEGATAINSAANDDEVVDLTFWYRRDS